MDDFKEEHSAMEVSSTSPAATPPPMEVKSSSNATPNTTHFRFLDLPAEIRNMTYTLALCEDQPILGHVNQSLTASILLVNRQLNAEATPLLYASNTSKIWTDIELYTFLGNIGKSRQYLRHIEFAYFLNFGRMHSALHLLKQAKSIEKFECIGHRMQKPKQQRNFEVFVPWLRALRKARKSQGLSDDVSTVAQFNSVKREFDRYFREDDALYNARIRNAKEFDTQQNDRLKKALA